MQCITLKNMKPPQAITIRPTPKDYKILHTLCSKLGINASSVIRQALRLLAAKEKVKA
jgi:hypothetical protein